MMVELYFRFKSFAYLFTFFFLNGHNILGDLLFFLCFFILLGLHFFFPLKFCRDEFLVTTRLIVLKFGDMIDMDMKFCKKISKFKMTDSKAGSWACPKTAQKS